MDCRNLVVIRGAGDLASGIALRLFHSGFGIVMTETDAPTTVRRTVAFSEAVRLGRTRVEDAEGVLCANPEEAQKTVREGRIAVLRDPECRCLEALKPDVLVDAILAKRNTGTRITDASAVIGVGPGFTAGVDCHAAVETMRGHTLGRTMYEGSPLPDTGIPGFIGGHAGERVLRAPAEGTFRGIKSIGDTAAEGETVAEVLCPDGSTAPVIAFVSGIIRGLLADGVGTYPGMKAGDVDPRGNREACFTVSDKALSVGGGVLEAILHLVD